MYDKIQNKENILIVLDEPDLSLHPEWQRKYIAEFMSTFSKLNKKIHLIITSHSPFILSDLPKQNVIFMKDGMLDQGIKHNQTFGANIHTLLSDSFFMEDGLMGEFAKSKIEEVIKLLKSKRKLSQKNKKLCEDTISIIGEPFLKSKLEKMYEVKFPKTQEEKIAELKAELER